MSGGGPEAWDLLPETRAPHFQGLWFDGHRITTSTPLSRWKHTDDLPRAQAVDGSALFALHVSDPTRPVSHQRWSLEFDLVLRRQEDKKQIAGLEALSHAAELVEIFWGEWGEDWWSIALAPEGQTTWTTYRGTPWHLPGIDPQDYPAKAWVRDPDKSQSDLVVIGAPGPAPGEIHVPGGQAAFTVETTDLHAAHPGGYLVLWYPMVVHGLVTVEWALQGANHLRAAIRFQEER